MKKYIFSIVVAIAALLFSGCHAFIYGYEPVHVRPHRVVYHTTHHVRRPVRVYRHRHYHNYRRRRPPVIVNRHVVVHKHKHKVRKHYRRHVHKNRSKTKVYNRNRGKYKKRYKKGRRR